MKKYFFILLFLTAGLSSLVSQTAIDSAYFGLVPPGKNPVVFAPGVLSVSNQGEEKLTISENGKEIYWNIHPMDYSYFKIKYSVFNSGNRTWSAPEYLFGKKYAHPVLTPDNNMLVVLDGKIYKSQRTDSGWAEPYLIDNIVFEDFAIGPLAITDDTTLCFIDLARSEHDIYISGYHNGHYQTPQRLPYPVNFDDYMVNNQYIAKDGSYILFSISDFPGGYGKADIFISFRKEGDHWTFPKNLGGHINTAEWEYGVYVSPDEKYLFFTRWEFDSDVNIHWCNIEGLFESIRNTNSLPYKMHLIPDQTDTAGNYYSYAIPDSVFIDDDGNETLTLSAKLSNGGDLPDSLIFNPETNTLSGKLLETGSFNIKITATDTADVSVSDIFNLKIEENTGIVNGYNIFNNFRVYPNPAANSLYIEYPELSNKKISYTITDIVGKTSFHGLLSGNVIDISRLNKGIYFLNIEIGEYVNNEKIIVE